MRGTPSTSATRVHGEARLQRRVLVEVVEDDERRRVALQLDRRARVVALADSSLTSAMPSISRGVDQLGDLGARSRSSRRLVRQLGDHDAVAARALLDLGHGPHADRAAAGAVGVDDARPAHDQRRRSGSRGPSRTASGRRGWPRGCRCRWTVASMTSPRLWGGMLVAMPTAMPWLPLTSRLGKRAGSTDGLAELARSSCRRSRRCPRRCRRASAWRAAPAGTRCSARRPADRRASRSCRGRRSAGGAGEKSWAMRTSAS